MEPAGGRMTLGCQYNLYLSNMLTMNNDDTQQRATEKIQQKSLFLKYPEAYYQYALEWCSYPHWTIEETANLLTGCVPHREMFLKGEDHVRLDDEVLTTENLIRAALHSELEVVKSRKYFGKTYLISEQVFDWAKRAGILIPKDLAKAEQVIRHRYQSDHYTTPCLEAAQWVVENFWENANLREPPTSGAVIQALLQQFPELSGARVTRHPLTRPD
jgi:hypothetical protein